MFGLFKRKKEEEYKPMFEDVTAAEEVGEVVGEMEENADPYADLEPGEVIDAPEEDGEITRLEDGREFPAAFVREIRSYAVEDLKTIVEEQGELYSPEEYAYINEVFHERLGDL